MDTEIEEPRFGSRETCYEAPRIQIRKDGRGEKHGIGVAMERDGGSRSTLWS